MIMNAAVIVCSDKGAKGLREDTSGEYIKDFLTTKKFEVLEKVIITDDLDSIKNKLLYYTDEIKIDLIVTTGASRHAIIHLRLLKKLLKEKYPELEKC